MTIESAPPSRADEFSLLDLVVTMAESWKLLVFGSLAVAIVVYAVLSFLPQKFEATVMVRLTSDQVAQVRAPKSMDALLAASGATPADEAARSAARAEMLRGIRMSDWDEKTGEVTLVMSGTTAQDAQSLLETLVTQVRSDGAVVTPQGESSYVQIELDAFREYNKMLRETLAAFHAKLASGGAPADPAPSDPESYSRAFSYLADQIRLSEVQMANIELQMASIKQARVKLEQADSPELPAVPQVRRTSSRPETIAVLSLIAAFILLLLFVFARDAIRKEMHNPESAGKVERIRNAVWRSRRAQT